MTLVWSEELSIGNALIDTDHKNLILKTNDVVQAIKSRDASELMMAFDQLESSLNTHFVNEEKVAHAIHFSFEKNEADHKSILAILKRIKGAVASMIAHKGAMTEDAVDHYSEFLCDWLTNHVINEDMLLKPALKEYPYDYTPD